MYYSIENSLEKVYYLVMFKRKIIEEMYKWKASNNKKALVIKGLRQIGKTYIIKAFAKENYDNIVYVDFKNNVSAKKIFDGDFNIDRIIIDLSSLITNTKFIPNKTVIIFDEIQECANARASLKAFVEDGRFDIIASGSLLGIKGYNKKISRGIPTGYEKIIYMKPMDFEEFLWAKGVSGDVINTIKNSYNNLTKVSDTVHASISRYFKEYICVGGLPSVVNTFISTNDMNAVYDEQRNLIDEYKDDFGKHLDNNENEVTNLTLLGRINRVFDSIPSQLAKENKKFVYSDLIKNARSSEYQTAIQWLYDFGLINICYNVSNIDYPLEGYKIDNIFKIYFQDTGLFMAMLGKETKYQILNGDINIYKGAIYENIVADAFSKNGIPLYYFHKDSGLEIDFVTRLNYKTTLIEVKATTGNTKSSNSVLNDRDKYKADQLIKLGDYNVGVKENKITLPTYMSFLLKD